MPNDKSLKTENCTCCGKSLNIGKAVELELSNTDDNYYTAIPEGHESQGFFLFGAACAKKILKNKDA